jgi:hypothetical protein
VWTFSLASEDGGRRDGGDGADGFGDVVVGDPGVEALEGGGEALGEDRVLEGVALAVECRGGDVGVAEAAEALDGGVFGEGSLVPGLAGWGHKVDSSGVTRSSPVRRADMRADLTD